jgi:PAS domain S-box-containing protein
MSKTYSYFKRQNMKDAGKTKAQLMSELVELRQRVSVLAASDTALKHSEERLAKISECFLNFRTDPFENINCLTALCGELLGATCALYNRLHRGLLYSWGQWNTPPGYNPVDKPEGHICYDVIKTAGDKVLVVSNLSDTKYAETDPNVIPYKLKTYVGRAVKFADAYVGSLCVVFQDDFMPSEMDKRLMEIIASAIGVEEKRKQVQEALQQKVTELNSFLNNIPDMAWLKDIESRFIAVNKAFGEAVEMDPESLLNQTCEVCFGEEGGRKFQEDDRIVTESGKQRVIEEQIVDSRGEEIWLETIKSPILEESGKVRGTVGIARDITKRKQAEEALRKAHSELERRVEERTDELLQMNERLKREIEERKQIEQELRKREAQLEIQTSELEELNTALRVLLKRRDEDKTEFEEKVLYNVKELVAPYVERLKSGELDAKQTAYVSILESNLNDIVSPFARRLSSKYLGLTPREIQIANLVKQGRTTKEIAEILHSSDRTVEFHRKNIRNKIGIVNRKVNLRSHLLTM